MIVVDASVLIAFLDDADDHHRPAFELFMLTDDYRMHTMTIAESLVRAARDGTLAETEQRLREIGIVEQERRPSEPAELARLRGGTGLRLPDCCVLMTAESTGGTLVTFDERLARAARIRGVDVLPEA